MINPIHITKLKLFYDVELIERICGYQKAKHFLFFIFIYKKNNLES